MNITFHGENGHCPHYIYKDIMFFIADKASNGNYYYQLYFKKIDWTENKEFENEDEAYKFVTSIKNVSFVTKSESYTLYETVLYNYIIKKNRVEIRKKPVPLTMEYLNYSDCLKASKEAVKQYIEQNYPTQMTLEAM